jgi:hypothetical protein
LFFLQTLYLILLPALAPRARSDKNDALQEEAQKNIRICKQHRREPLVLAAWHRWAEELPEFDERVFQAAKQVEPLIIRVNHAIDTGKHDPTIAHAEDVALDSLFTLAGWLEHGLKERAVEQAAGGMRVPAATHRLLVRGLTAACADVTQPPYAVSAGIRARSPGCGLRSEEG